MPDANSSTAGSSVSYLKYSVLETALPTSLELMALSAGSTIDMRPSVAACTVAEYAWLDDELKLTTAPFSTSKSADPKPVTGSENWMDSEMDGSSITSRPPAPASLSELLSVTEAG